MACAVDTARIEQHGTYIAQGGGQKSRLLVSESLAQIIVLLRCKKEKVQVDLDVLQAQM